MNMHRMKKKCRNNCDFLCCALEPLHFGGKKRFLIHQLHLHSFIHLPKLHMYLKNWYSTLEFLLYSNITKTFTNYCKLLPIHPPVMRVRRWRSQPPRQHHMEAGSLNAHCQNHHHHHHLFLHSQPCHMNPTLNQLKT